MPTFQSGYTVHIPCFFLWFLILSMPHMLIIELWLLVLKWWHQVVFCCLTTTMWEDSPSLPKFFVYIPSIYLHRLLFCKHESSSYTSVYRLWCILYFWQHISLGLFNRFHSTELWIYLSLETIIDDVLKLMVQQAVNTGEMFSSDLAACGFKNVWIPLVMTCVVIVPVALLGLVLWINLYLRTVWLVFAVVGICSWFLTDIPVR